MKKVAESVEFKRSYTGIPQIEDEKTVIRSALVRLQRYEDSGLDPEEVKNLRSECDRLEKEAEKTKQWLQQKWNRFPEDRPVLGDWVIAKVEYSAWIEDYENKDIPDDKKMWHPKRTEILPAIYERVGDLLEFRWRIVDKEGRINIADNKESFKEFTPGTPKAIVKEWISINI